MRFLPADIAAATSPRLIGVSSPAAAAAERIQSRTAASPSSAGPSLHCVFRAASADSVPLVLRDDSEKIFDAYDAGAGNMRDGGLVHRSERSSDARWTDDAPMQHPVNDEIMDIDMSARELGGQVRPLHLLADDAVGRRAAQRGFWIDLQRKATISDQPPEAYACAACARAHFAVQGVEIARRQSQPLRRQVDQSDTRRRRRPPNLHAALGDAGAAPRRSLIGGQRRVAFDQMNAIDGDAELFRNDLPVGDAQARSDVDLAAKQSQ